MKYIAYHYQEGDAKLDFSFQPDAPLQLKINFLAILLQAANDIKTEVEDAQKPATGIPVAVAPKAGKKVVDPTGQKLSDLPDKELMARRDMHNIAAPHDHEICPICVECKKRGL